MELRDILVNAGWIHVFNPKLLHVKTLDHATEARIRRAYREGLIHGNPTKVTVVSDDGNVTARLDLTEDESPLTAAQQPPLDSHYNRTRFLLDTPEVQRLIFMDPNAYTPADEKSLWDLLYYYWRSEHGGRANRETFDKRTHVGNQRMLRQGFENYEMGLLQQEAKAVEATPEIEAALDLPYRDDEAKGVNARLQADLSQLVDNTQYKFWITPAGKLVEIGSGDTHVDVLQSELMADDYERLGQKMNLDDEGDWGEVVMALVPLAEKRGYFRGWVIPGDAIGIAAPESAMAKLLGIVEKHNPEWVMVHEVLSNRESVEVLEGEDAVSAWKHRKDTRHRQLV